MQRFGLVLAVGRTSAAVVLASLAVLLGAVLLSRPLRAAASVSAADSGAPARHGASSAERRRRRTRLVLLQHATLRASADAATLTLSLSGPVRMHLLHLHRPERLVIDLPHARRSTPLPAVAASSLIAAVRSGAPSAGRLRLVLALRADARVAVLQRAAAHGHETLRLSLARMPGAAAAPQDMQAAALSLPLPRAAEPVRHPALASLPPAPAQLSHAIPRLHAIPGQHAPQGFHDVVVVVDAGHGGVDPGAIGRDGTHEKDLTLAIARDLATRIDRAPGMRAVLTREGDYFITLSDRLERARRAHADFFVSIHADSVRDPVISGASVYVLSERGASSEAARRLAAEENAADLRGGISLDAQAPALRSVLLDLSQSASIGESAEAAQQVLSALEGVGAVRTRAVQRAAFVVLKSPYIPSMLVETAYISNHADEQRLKSPVEQQRLAAAIFQGIADYFRQYPPPGSLFARDGEPAAPAAS